LYVFIKLFYAKRTKFLEDLFIKTTDFLKKSKALLSLKATGMKSEMASSFVTTIVIAGVSCIIIIFLNSTIAFWLGSILNQLYLGFLAISVFYILLFMILCLGRIKFLNAPVMD
jgi:hypothetical protein